MSLPKGGGFIKAQGDTLVSRNPRIRFRIAGDEGFLSDPSLRANHRLNPTAAFVWRLLEEERRFDDVVAEVAREYEASPERVRSGVTRALEDMWRLGLLVFDGDLAPDEVRQVALAASRSVTLAAGRPVTETGSRDGQAPAHRDSPGGDEPRADRSPRPEKCSIELTWRCNLACRHCYAESPLLCRPSAGGGAGDPVRLAVAGRLAAAFDGDELDAAAWAGVLRQLADLGTIFLTITGGEPLLSPVFASVVRAAEELGFVIRLLTNATLATEDTVALLAWAGCNDVEVSIHGPDAEVHDSFTGVPGSFAAALRGVGLFVAGGIKTHLKFPITRLNEPHASRMVDLAGSLDLDYVLNPMVYPTTGGSRDPLNLRVSDEQLGRLMSAGHYTPHRAPCNTVTGKCRIGPDGRVYPCEFVPWVLGDLRRQSLEDIWLGPRANELRASGAFLDHGPACETCPDVELCPRCPAIALMDDGDVFGPSREACRHVRVWKAIKGGVPA